MPHLDIDAVVFIPNPNAVGRNRPLDARLLVVGGLVERVFVWSPNCEGESIFFDEAACGAEDDRRRRFLERRGLLAAGVPLLL